MDNFLKNNQDYSFETSASPKPRKKNRFGLVVSLCALVVFLGFGSAAGTTLLAGRLSGLEVLSDRNNPPSTHDPGNVSLINTESTPDGSNNNWVVPDEELAVTIDGNLVINTNNVELTPRELFRKVRDGVVGIEITQRVGGGIFSAGFEDTQLVGSGFLFTTDGYVLTNEHVISGALAVYVLVDDYIDPEISHRYEAEVVGMDSATDLAILKISRSEPFRALPIGDSSSLEVGSFVSPIGFPLGLEKSMTFGIVSGLNRELPDAGYELSSIQFDASVNPGNSGGPLFDMLGNVVGIVNKKLIFQNQVDNIGLAITINEAKPIINDLLRHGTVMSRPMLGISSLHVLNEYSAAMHGFDLTSGILVLGINPNAPAFHSDLAVGDVIVEVNGFEVATVTDVQTQIRHFSPGDEIELTVIRRSEAGNQRRFTIKLELANAADIER